MKWRKLVFLWTVVLTINWMLAAPSAAEEAEYILLYNNSFDNGAEGGAEAVNCQTPYYDLTLNIGAAGWNTASYDGNVGVATNGNAWPADRTFLFDFTKGGAQNGVSSGIYKFSFDFSPGSGGGDVAWIGQNMSIFYDGGRMLATGDKDGTRYFGAVASVGSWDAANSILLDQSQKYHVESVLNFTTNKVHTYVDGVLLGETLNLQVPMNNYSMALCGYWDYFDNLKLEYYANLPMEMSVEEMSPDKISLNFTDGISNPDIFHTGIAIKNRYTGEEIPASVTVVNDKNVAVVPEENLIAGYEYTLIFPDGITGMEGSVLENNAVDFNMAESGALKALRLKSLSGETTKLEEENPAELQSLIFEFTEDVTAYDALSGLTITDQSGSSIAFEKRGEGNMGEAVFTDAILLGNASYTLKLEGLSVPYEIKIHTAQGKIAIGPIKLYQADGVTEIESFDDFSEGDRIIASFDAVNTSDKEISYFAVLAMYCGKQMGNITFETAQLLPGSKKALTLSVTVENKTDLSFQGTLWDAEHTWPITKSTGLNSSGRY